MCRNRTGIWLGLAVVMAPVTASANALIPALWLNAYRSGVDFWYSFSVVILIESVLAWLWVRPMRYGKVLWRMVVVNAVSSLTGYVAVREDWVSSSSIWSQAIPMFFLTLGTEFPLIWVLFRGNVSSWKRAAAICATVNLASYAVLIPTEQWLRSAWFAQMRAQDAQVLREWSDTNVLAQASGRIYGTESGPGRPHRLRFFDLGDRRWHSMTNCPPLDPCYWDIEGNLLAFYNYENGRGLVSLVSLPGFSPVREIPLPATSYPYYTTQREVSLSPDGSRLAVLIPLHDIQAPNGDSSYTVFGTACRLVVFDTGSGKELGVCSRQAAGGLCWLPDSDAVLFNSLRDEKLFDVGASRQLTPREGAALHLDRALSDRPLYAFTIASGVVRAFGEMSRVHLASASRQLAWREGPDTIRILDLNHATTKTLKMETMGHSDFAISPDGRFLIVPFRLQQPLAYLGHPTILSIQEPGRRYYLGNDYKFKWTGVGLTGDATAVRTPAHQRR